MPDFGLDSILVRINNNNSIENQSVMGSKSPLEVKRVATELLTAFLNRVRATLDISTVEHVRFGKLYIVVKTILWWLSSF